MATLGERIKELRKQNHLNQTELAEKLGVTLGTVSTWERNLFKPDFASMDKMSLLFRASYDYLLGKSDSNDFEVQNEKEIQIDNWAQFYSTLDIYGRNAVENAIRCEFDRCKQQNTLLPASLFNVECFSLKYSDTDIQQVVNDDSQEIAEYALKFARLDNYGRDLVRESIRVARSRCDAQGSRQKMNQFVVDVSTKE